MTVIPVESDTMHTAISTRFGKSPWFAFVSEEGTITMEPNPDIDTMKMLEWLLKKGARRVITAHIGPKPFKMFEAKGIETFNPGRGNIRLINVIGMMEIGKLERITLENLHRFYTDKPKDSV
jgi:predicted Fe-Mo cluster-binding NifX family protein